MNAVCTDSVGVQDRLGLGGPLLVIVPAAVVRDVSVRRSVDEPSLLENACFCRIDSFVRESRGKHSVRETFSSSLSETDSAKKQRVVGSAKRDESAAERNWSDESSGSFADSRSCGDVREIIVSESASGHRDVRQGSFSEVCGSVARGPDAHVVNTTVCSVVKTSSCSSQNC